MAETVIKSIMFMFGLGDNPIPKQSNKTDSEWLESDWIAVGNDLRNAMNTYEQTH